MGKEKKYWTQRYRKEWEKEEWARGWLSISKHNNGKAYCNFCKKDLVVGKSELVSHTKSSQHRNNAKVLESN